MNKKLSNTDTEALEMLGAEKRTNDILFRECGDRAAKEALRRIKEYGNTPELAVAQVVAELAQAAYTAGIKAERARSKDALRDAVKTELEKSVDAINNRVAALLRA